MRPQPLQLLERSLEPVVAEFIGLGYENVFFYEADTGGHGKSYSPEEEAMVLFLTNLHPDYRQAVLKNRN